jgi:hypothetical protein
MRRYLILFLFCIIASAAFGQQEELRGQVYETGTRIPIAQIAIQNLNNKVNTVTDDRGFFVIKAKMGDVLVFNGFTYVPDTLLLTDMNAKVVFLTLRSKMLKEVQVKQDSSNFKLGNDPMFHNQTVRYQRDANFNPVGGIAIKLDDSHSDERRRTHTKQQLKDQAVLDEINKIFVPATIGKYVPLKGADLEDFISLYTPTIDVYTDKSFSLLVYLSDSYKAFMALPESERHLEKLN